MPRRSSLSCAILVVNTDVSMVAISTMSCGLPKDMLDAAVAAHVERERAWLPHDHSGRWVVLEPGAARYLPDSSRAMRRYIDAITPRRARRFSSLSRARAFANRVGGTVHHWRRTPPLGGIWQRQSPWQRAIKGVRAGFLVTKLLCDDAKITEAAL